MHVVKVTLIIEFEDPIDAGCHAGILNKISDCSNELSKELYLAKKITAKCGDESYVIYDEEDDDTDEWVWEVG